MFIGRLSTRGSYSIVDADHPVSILSLMLFDDGDLIVAFHNLLDEIQYRQRKHMRASITAELMETAQNIMELVFRDHGGWAFLQL